jgi:molybdate transport system substrate-binding protein
MTVFAAASLTESFGEIGAAFERRHPGIKVVFNFAGSQQLRSQLEQGALADVFASANPGEMDASVAAGVVRADSVRDFARNRLVVIYPRRNPAAIATLADLARPGVKIDLADPAVPAGKYTVQMLEATGIDAGLGPAFKSKVLANVVSREENVKSVVAKVRLGEADAGVVYATDAAGEAGKDLGVLSIPDAINQTASYPVGVAIKSGQPEAAAQFIQYLLSPDGQRVMQRHGFLPARPTNVRVR